VGPRAKARIPAPPSSFSAAHFSGAARQSVASAKEDVAFARLTVNVGSLDVHELHFFIEFSILFLSDFTRTSSNLIRLKAKLSE
jgi:hypothetical protein